MLGFEILKEFLHIFEALAAPSVQFVHCSDRSGVRNLDGKRQPLFLCHSPEQQADRFRHRKTHFPKRFRRAILGVAIKAGADDGIGSHCVV